MLCIGVGKGVGDSQFNEAAGLLANACIGGRLGSGCTNRVSGAIACLGPKMDEDEPGMMMNAQNMICAV